MSKTTVSVFAGRREAGEKLVMITAGSAAESHAAYAAGIDLILVGDSLGMTMLGYSSTLPMTMEMMLHHTAAVRRGAPEAFVIFDMPFMSYQTGLDEAVRNAGRALQEAGADAVKLEGGADPELIRRLVASGIPVLGHLGLLPQRIQTVGGYRIVGRGGGGGGGLAGRSARRRGGWGFRGGVGVRPGGAGQTDHRRAAYSDHRHRFRGRLLRAGSGAIRLARSE